MQHANKTCVLFVCLGNICRSPTAQAVFARRATDAGLLELTVESAGTGAWHAGEPPDARAIEAGRARGYDFTGQSARQVETLDFARFDYILAMDADNLSYLKSIAPVSYRGHLSLFLDFCDNSRAQVPDPYYAARTDLKPLLT